jgi:hypothetical protein
MVGVDASMGAMRSSPERGRRGKGKRRQGARCWGGHGEREGCHGEGLLGATPCSWLLYVCSGSFVRTRKQQEGEEKKEKRKKKMKKWEKFVNMEIFEKIR